MTREAFEQFNIQLGGELTWNVAPLLHEIRHALGELLKNDASSVIDLRSIPLAPGEEEILLEKLGRGEVQAKLDALGPSEIYETRYAGVWLVTHFNADNSIIGRFIEVTRIPGILKAQQEDMQDSLAQLETVLADEESQHNQDDNDANLREVN